MNLFEKIQEIRNALKSKDIKQTGYNSYADYSYFELDDFLKPVNELMKEYKITAIPSFTKELATLTVVNSEKPEEMFTITSPFGTAQLKGCHEVQNIGAIETYQRRYLYQALFDISESDALNKTQGKPSQATSSQSPSTNPQTQQTGKNTAKNEAKYQCEMCKASVTENVAKYSKDIYGKVLCFECQKKQKQNKEELPF